MVDVWGFSFVSCDNFSDGVDVSIDTFQQTFDRHIETVIAAEKLGFDGWAWAEHHFSPSSNTPSPHLLIAAIGARTTKLRLSVLGSVLPLHDPRRVVEEIGMLDYLTHGRYEPGIAPGAGPAECIKAGIDPSEQRSRYQSGAEFIRKAIGSREITHQDSFTNVTDLQIVPPLRPELANRVWTAILSQESAIWAAENGFRIVTAWLPTPVANMRANAYREAADKAGWTAGAEMLGLRRRVFVAETDAQAQEIYEQSVDMVLTVASKGLETADPAILQLMTHPDDIIMGSPASVAERLVTQCEAGGYGTVFAFTDFATFPADALSRSHRLIAERVAPELKAANVGARAFSA